MTVARQPSTAGPSSGRESVRGGSLQRRCACGSHAPGGGPCPACREKPSGSLQAKLALGAPRDVYEDEADRVAERVMATPAHAAPRLVAPRLQRRSPAPSGDDVDAVPASVERALASSGRPLEPALREDMEQRFGHDFSTVRVHTDAAAERSARDVSAHAYAVGRDVVFGRQQFSPATVAGRQLLAHGSRMSCSSRRPRQSPCSGGPHLTSSG